MKKFQTGFASIILILLFLLGIIGYFSYQWACSHDFCNTRKQQPITVSITPTQSNWKTYTSEQYGFSFQYPNDFSIEELEQGKKIKLWFPKPTGEIDIDPESMYFEIEDNPKGLTSQQIEEEDIQNLRKKDQTLQFVADKEERSLKPYHNGVIDGVSFQSGADYDFDVILFTHNAYTYTITSTHYEIEPGQTVKSKGIVNTIVSSFKFIKTNTGTSPVKSSDQPIISIPQPNTKVTSPLTVKGTAPANWFFEGQIHLKLVDANKKVIAGAAGKEVTPGSWMEDKPVEFEGTIQFATTAKNGFLIIENDNPSGLSENQKTFEIPVTF